MTPRQWFSFGGRIRRRSWWLYYVAVPIGMNAAAVLLDRFVLPMSSLPALFGTRFDSLSLLSMAIILIGAWLGLAGHVKRLHDHGVSGAWALASPVPLLALALFLAFPGRDVGPMGWYMFVQHAFPVAGLMWGYTLQNIPTYSHLMWWLAQGVFISWIMWVWFMFINGCVPGTRGPNRFGPDPRMPDGQAGAEDAPAPSG